MRFVIPGKLASMNQFISANRTSVHVGNKLKQDSQANVMHYIPKWKQIEKPVIMEYRFFEPDRRRDLDNISSFALKVIQDGLVAKGILANDGWDNIQGFSVQFFVDKKNPRIEIDIHEVTI
jgi:Holliday junction resolvase RusA-like endonuclease